MIIVKNNIIPFKGFLAMFFFGILFVRKDSVRGLTPVAINHEEIHSRQCLEMLGVFFYLWYGIEYLIRLVINGGSSHKAYRNISFEREAYDNESVVGYPRSRRMFAWIKYL